MEKEVQDLQRIVYEKFEGNQEIFQVVRTNFPQHGSIILGILERMGITDPNKVKRVLNIPRKRANRHPGLYPGPQGRPAIDLSNPQELIVVYFLDQMEKTLKDMGANLEKVVENHKLGEELIERMKNAEVGREWWKWEEWGEWVKKTAGEILREMG